MVTNNKINISNSIIPNDTLYNKIKKKSNNTKNQINKKFKNPNHSKKL